MKRVLSALLIAALMLAATACSTGNSNPSSVPAGNFPSDSQQSGNSPQITPNTQTPSNAAQNLTPEPSDQFVYEFARVYDGGIAYERGDGTYSDNNGLTVTDCSEGLVLTKYLGDKTQLRVPDEIEGFPVVGIAAKCFEVGVVTDVGYPNTLRFFELGNPSYNDKLSMNLSGELIIPHGVTKIVSIRGWSNDSAVRNVTSVRLPETLREINHSAFDGFESLTSIDIPHGVTSIGGAFGGCSSLLRIEFPDSLIKLDGYAFDTTSWYRAQQNGMVYAGNVAYNWKGEMPPNTHITLEEGTKAIASGAFGGRNGLTGITIPNGVSFIGEAAFSSCTELTSITLPDSVLVIEGSTFNGCTGLTSISLSRNLTYIGNGAFADCKGLTNIILPDSVVFVGNEAFRNCTGLISVTFGSGLTRIEHGLFVHCSSLTSINLDSIIEIGEVAFRGCDSLPDETKNMILALQPNAFN